MRIRRTPAGVLLLALAASSCSQNPVAPLGFEPAGAGDSQTLLTRGPSDPRLPPPGHEASSAAPEERALFDRLESAAGEAKLNASSNPVVFWNQLTRDLGVAAKLPPPMLARDYALVQVGVFEALVVSEDHLRGHLPPRAVAAGVASRGLTFLFPGDGALIDAAAAEQIALAGGPRGAALGGWALGRAVRRIVVARGLQDGSDLPFDGTVPSGDGTWTATNPARSGDHHRDPHPQFPDLPLGPLHHLGGRCRRHGGGLSERARLLRPAIRGSRDVPSLRRDSLPS